jgi:hypothetical protein
VHFSLHDEGMCTAEWRSNEGEKRKKKSESFSGRVAGDFIRAAGHLRKTYVPACDNNSSVARLAKTIGEVSCRMSSRVQPLRLLQVPFRSNNQDLPHLH